MLCNDDHAVVDGLELFLHVVVQTTSEGIVTRCADGFYTDDGVCIACVGCAMRLNATTCLSCGEEDILSGTTCENGTEVSRKCKALIRGNFMCDLPGKLLPRGECVVCPDNSVSCAKGGCCVCIADFWLKATSLLCESFSSLTHYTANPETRCVS